MKILQIKLNLLKKKISIVIVYKLLVNKDLFYLIVVTIVKRIYFIIKSFLYRYRLNLL